VIEFHLDTRSGVPTYLQLVQQVKQAVRLGILRPGDQLPTVKDVVGSLAINPNTVLKAYRELDHEGLVEGKRGQGTFVSSELPSLPPDETKSLRSALQRWLERARAAGLDDESIADLIADTVRPSSSVRAA
jgi:GntR family transcriptional regulator